MSNNPSSPSLYRIDECPDLMADACVSDASGHLVFLSVWGRDTAIQQFLARLTLGRGDEGLDQFHLVSDEGASIPVFVGSIDSLEKRTTRALRHTLFGAMVHLWLFNKRCVEPSQSIAYAMALCPKAQADPDDRLWPLVKETCPLPLLDHWRDSVLFLLRSKSMLTRMPLALGALDGYLLDIDVEALTEALSELIQREAIGISPQPLQHTLLQAL